MQTKNKKSFNRGGLRRLVQMALAAALAAGLGGCSGVPEGVMVVDGFELQRYLGTWYEIARLDHSFERGMSQVTAEYTRRDDGRVDVVNRGYNDAKGKWSSAKAIAKLAGEPTVGSLKVSFFRPFWADYHIILLDKTAYSYAMVTSSSRDYLWILSRTPTLEDEILQTLVTQARTWGYATDELIYVEQEPKKD